MRLGAFRGGTGQGWVFPGQAGAVARQALPRPGRRDEGEGPAEGVARALTAVDVVDSAEAEAQQTD